MDEHLKEGSGTKEEIDWIELTPEEAEHHRFSKKIINPLEAILMVAGIPTIIGYGFYKCLPNPTQQLIQNIPSETYRVCSDIYQYLTQFIS